MLNELEAPPALEGDLDGAARWLEQDAREQEPALVDLVGARRELTALETRADKLVNVANADKVAALKNDAASARAAADA